MLNRLLLTAACLIAASRLATAQPITVKCNVTSLPSKDRHTRVITIDPQNRTVFDDALVFKDGAETVLGGGSMEQFMHFNDGKATWGVQGKADHSGLLTMFLDLSHGTYSIDTPYGRSEGTCYDPRAVPVG